MKNIIVISGHNDLESSVANKTILAELEKSLDNSEFVYLDKLYPTYQIDALKEQDKLLDKDIILLQFPLFWYAMPALLKRWFETVLVHGFSHGSKGNKLKGKRLLLSFTTGSPAEAYTLGGPRSYPIEDFLLPIKAIADLAGLEYMGYVYTGGVSYQNRITPEGLELIKQKALSHVDKLMDKLQEISN